MVIVVAVLELLYCMCDIFPEAEFPHLYSLTNSLLPIISASPSFRDHSCYRS